MQQQESFTDLPLWLLCTKLSDQVFRTYRSYVTESSSVDWTSIQHTPLSSWASSEVLVLQTVTFLCSSARKSCTLPGIQHMCASNKTLLEDPLHAGLHALAEKRWILLTDIRTIKPFFCAVNPGLQWCTNPPCPQVALTVPCASGEPSQSVSLMSLTTVAERRAVKVTTKILCCV